MVEEVGLRRMPVAVAVASLTAVAGLLAVTTAAAGCRGGDTGSDHVMVNGGEPQNPLIPTNTNETNGGRIWAKPQYSGGGGDAEAKFGKAPEGPPHI